MNEHVTESGLVAVYRSASAKAIEKQLKKIDERLFLDPEHDAQYGLFWTVKFWNGERAPSPVTVVVDWRESDGRPKDLTDGLLYEVNRIRQRGPLDLREVVKRNRDLRERRSEQSELAYEERSKEAIRWLRTKPIFPRGTHLRKREVWG